MKIKFFKVEKLIRDKIPAFLESKGIAVHAKAMEDQEFISKLKDKLLEEVQEVLEASGSDELCEELADVLEVIHALSKANGLTMQQIEKIRLKKREIKGGFENKIFNSSIQIEENNTSIHYYLNKPQKYPEIETSE